MNIEVRLFASLKDRAGRERIPISLDRITSYNVCYTKLLRSSGWPLRGDRLFSRSRRRRNFSRRLTVLVAICLVAHVIETNDTHAPPAAFEPSLTHAFAARIRR